MLTLEFTEKELKDMNYDKTVMRNILVSRAIYNESYNHDFTSEELQDIKYLEKSEALKFYMRKTIAPRVMVTENSIIERYNQDKAYFETNKIPFAKARDMIKNALNNEVNEGLEQDLVTNLVHNMSDTVTLKKEDIVYSKGDPNLIKTMVLIELLEQEAKKINFFEENKEDLDIINKEIRIKYFVNAICAKKILVTNDEISKFYADNEKDFENTNFEVAYDQIGAFLYNSKYAKETEEYIESIAKKYHIDEEIEKYTINSDEVLN